MLKPHTLTSLKKSNSKGPRSSGDRGYQTAKQESLTITALNFLMTFFSHRKLQNNKYTAKMASAARRQIIGGSAPINKSRRRWRPQIGGGGGGAARSQREETEIK